MKRFKLLTIAAWVGWFIGAILCATQVLTEFGIALLLAGGVAMAVRGRKNKEGEV